MIGSIQSMFTDFPGLRPIWKQNCDEERLLGVDITGQMDCQAVQSLEVKSELRKVAIDTNKVVAAKLGINQSASVTCVKPSGNTSQLVDCSSGLHVRWSKYYVRNVRVPANSPVYKVFKEAGVPMDVENGQEAETANTFVAHFPVKSPDGAITRRDVTAVRQCEIWQENKLGWTEMNPSVTISYDEHELPELLEWILSHRGIIGGMAYLPKFNAQYAQLPYIEITEAEYNQLKAVFPKVDFSRIVFYDGDTDLTTSSQELACSAGNCEIDYVPQIARQELIEAESAPSGETES